MTESNQNICAEIDNPIGISDHTNVVHRVYITNIFGDISGPVHTGSGDIDIQTASEHESIANSNTMSDENDQRLREIIRQVWPLYAQLQGTPFADHGIGHHKELLTYLEVLIHMGPTDSKYQLSGLEKFVLMATAVLHDISLCYPDLSQSSLLQENQLVTQTTNLTPEVKEALLTKFWSDLSIEMIENSFHNSSQFPYLGLQQSNPSDLVVNLLSYLPNHIPVSKIPEKFAVKGALIRGRLLASILRLATCFESLSQPIDTNLADSTLRAKEIQLFRWLKYYFEYLELDDKFIIIYIKVPSEKYEFHIINAFYSFFIRRWDETAVALLENEWQMLSPKWVVTIDPTKEKMPANIWAILKNPERLSRNLTTATELLGTSTNDKMAYIEPYYYGAVSEVSRFSWEQPTREQLTYLVSLTDMTANKHLWLKSDVGSPPFPYPQDEKPLLHGHQYRWAVYGKKKDGKQVMRVTGDFWLLDESSKDHLAHIRDKNNQNINELTQCGLYLAAIEANGDAIKALQQAAEKEQSQSIIARRALADIYEKLFYELSRLRRNQEADVFLDLANEQYTQLRRTLSPPD